MRCMTSPKRSRRSSDGAIDRLPSGAWRARHTGPDGKRRTKSFPTKADARAWINTQAADVVRREWRAPEVGRRTVGDYAADYLARPDLRESTRTLYERVWRVHLDEVWTSTPVGEVTVEAVRRWHERVGATTAPTALVQAYRLLRAVLNVALNDGAIRANPATVRGAAVHKPARATRSLSPEDVVKLAEAVPPRYSVLVLVLAWSGLRFGEAAALRRQDVSADGRLLTVERGVWHDGHEHLVGDVKTAAGRRRVALPDSIATALVEHLREFVPRQPDALVFGTRSGGFLARSNFSSMFSRAVTRCELPPTRPHELRHTGATLAAAAGASLREVMTRLGHSSPAAALVYQHASEHRDDEIARALDVVAAATPRRVTSTAVSVA